MKVTELTKILNEKKEIKKIKKLVKTRNESLKIVLVKRKNHNFSVCLEAQLYDDLGCNYDSAIIESWEFFNENEFKNYCPILTEQRVNELLENIVDYASCD